MTMHSSLRAKILLLMLILALLPLLVVGWLGLAQIERAQDTAVAEGTNALRMQAEATLLQRVTATAMLYDQALLSVQQQVRASAQHASTMMLSSQSVVGDRPRVWIAPAGSSPHNQAQYATSVGQARRVVPLLDSVVQGNPLLNVGYVGLQDGGVLVFNDDQVIDKLFAVAPFDPRERPWYRSAWQQGDTVWTDAYVDANTQLPIITCATPLYDQDGAMIGVMGFDILLDTLKQAVLMPDSEIGATGYPQLINSTGSILTQPDTHATHWNEPLATDNWLTSPDPDLRALTRRMLQREQGVAQVDYDGIPVYVAFAPMSTAEWSVALVVPVTTIIQPALDTGVRIQQGQAQLQRQLLIVIVVTAILICGIGVLMALSITRPIRALRNGASLIARGDLNHQLPPGGNDEIGQLVRSFNAMTAALRQKMAELETNAAQLSTLQRMSNQLKAILDLNQVFELTPRLVCEHFGLDRAILYVVEDRHLRVVAAAFGSRNAEQARQFIEAARAKPLSLDSNIIEADVVRESQAVIINTPQSHAPVGQASYPYGASEAYIQVPIIGREKQVIGVISADNHPGGRCVTLRDVNQMLMFANMVGLTIENVRLYDDLERQVAHRTTELRVALEEARQADRRKSDFLASISHELRTPLNAIIGFSTVLLDEIDGPLLDMQREDVQSINRNGRFLLHLINELLDLARIEAGRLDMEYMPLDLAVLCAEVIDTVEALLRSDQVTLQLQVPDDLPLVQADGARVRQILLNLLSNAVKFTEQGRITLSVRCLVGHEIHAHRPVHRYASAALPDSPGPPTVTCTDSRFDVYVAISVADTGVGIAPEFQDRLFEEFSQIHRQHRRMRGTGLGLAITRRLVEAHGGWIRVESMPDVGSTFTFTLPVSVSRERTVGTTT